VLYIIQNAVVFIATVQIKKVKMQTSNNFRYKANLNLNSKQFIIRPEISATIPIANPIHGIYIKPAELYKNPTKSPKKQATNP
jgi:hypothetical protein